jgi:hypothetical protein
MPPAHRRQLRLIKALKLERSLQSRCLEVSIPFISGPLDVLHQIIAPYRDREIHLDYTFDRLLRDHALELEQQIVLRWSHSPATMATTFRVNGCSRM